MRDIHIIGWLLTNDLLELVYAIINFVFTSNLREKLCLDEIMENPIYEEILSCETSSMNKFVAFLKYSMVLEKYSYGSLMYFLRFFFEFSDLLVCGINFIKFYHRNWC